MEQMYLDVYGTHRRTLGTADLSHVGNAKRRAPMERYAGRGRAREDAIPCIF